MEIEVGDYVRTVEGYIDIFIETNDEKNIARCEKRKYWLNSIIKHSKNIIELIEEDDVGILSYHELIFKKFITKDDILELKFGNYKLLKIVTKEMFESVEYEVQYVRNSNVK